MSELKAYLEQCTRARDALSAMNGRTERPWMFEDYFLKHGQPYPSAPLTLREQAILAKAIERSRCDFPIKQCFSNSQRVVLADYSNTLRYAEGYVTAIIPIHHGWIDINGKVVDLTLRYPRPSNYDMDETIEYHTDALPDHLANRVAGVLPPEMEYWGLSFDQHTVRTFMLETETWGSLLDDWKRGHPLMKASFDSRRKPIDSTVIEAVRNVQGWMEESDA